MTPTVAANSGWFNELQVGVSNTQPLTALSVTIVVQRTTGVSFNGQYNTVGGQISQSNSSTAATITYTFSLGSGQTLGAGTGRTFAAQFGGTGTVHPTAGDTWALSYTAGGQSFSQTGSFGGSASDFTLSASPSNLSVTQGSGVTSTITIARTNFTSAVTLSASGLPNGVTATFNPSSTTGNTSTLTLAASATATLGGPLTATITGTGGGLTHTTSISLTVTSSGLVITVTPSSVSVAPGATANATVSVSGGGGNTTCNISGLPSGVSASFSPTPFTTSTTMTLTAAANTPPSSSSPTLTCTRSGASGIGQFSLTVSGFTLSTNPTSLSLSAGQSGSSTITITRTSFTSSVAFSATGQPSGVTVTFNPTSTTGNSATANFAVATGAAAGTFPITITGSSGTQTSTGVMTLTISGAGFNAALTPTTYSLAQGGSATGTITITRTGGFSGSVSCSVTGLPTPIIPAIAPSPITGNTATLTLTAAANASIGTSAGTLTCTASGVTQTMTFTVNIIAGGFTIAVSPTSYSVSPGGSVTGTVTIVRSSYTGAVALTATGQPSGVTVSFNPASVTSTTSTVTFAAASGATSGTSTVTISGTGGGFTGTASAAVTVGSASTVFRVDPTGRITKNGQNFPVHCGSWFGLQGRYEIASDPANPRGAPMEQYVGNTFWASDHSRTVIGDAKEIAAAGINLVRLPLVHETLDPNDPQGKNFLKNYSGIINDATYPMTNSRQGLESMIKALNAAGIYVLLDIHSCSNYVDWRKGRLDARPPYVDAKRDNYDFTREDSSCSATNNPASVTRIQAYDEPTWLNDLKTIAGLGQQLGVNNILGIDLFNEPWDYSWADWKKLTEDAYQAINPVNPNILLFVEGVGSSSGNQDGTPDTTTPTPFGSAATNPNWGENLYEAGSNPPNIPQDRLVFSPHTYGPSVAVQRQFMDPTQPQCAGLEGDAAGDAKCNIVINPTLLQQGWQEHFGYLRDQGYAVVVGEFGGNLDWPKGKASIRDQNRYSYLPDNTVDAQWQNAFVDYMTSKGIQACYWSINPESGDTGGWYSTPYDPISNTSAWGVWGPFDTRRTNLLNRLWSSQP